MSEREKIISLYDIYKNLLTEKQQEYFEYYYFEDLSLNEISSLLNVSKTMVGKTLNKIASKLEEYETKLNVNKLYKSIEEIISITKDNTIKEKLENILKEN